MASVSLGDNIGVREEVIKKASSMATEAHHRAQTYLYEEVSRPGEAISSSIWAFPGSWSVNDLYGSSGDDPYGAIKVDAALFPSLKYIGLDEPATLNEAFVERFKTFIRANHQLIKEVEGAMAEGKQVVFTGHSTGAPIAILVEIWFLEHHIRRSPNIRAPKCITFGSPLVGDRVMNHALGRESWSHHFIHFIMRYDIIPRVMLAPRSSVEGQLQHALNYINRRSQLDLNEMIAHAPGLYQEVMRNAASVASFSACKIMGNTNSLSENLSSIINLSPYRPFGTYVLCIGNGKFVVVRNPDAVLQILFYSLQLSDHTSAPEHIVIAQASLSDHWSYELEMTASLDMWSVTCLEHNHLLAIPLTSRDANDRSTTILDDLGLSVRARLCFRAAAELEGQKLKNQDTLDEKKPEITKCIEKLQKEYKVSCRNLNLGYYEAFKMAEREEDFQANISRLELAGMWDEMVEMLKRYELPDGFECREEWEELGTLYRCLVEPLDIANYYRHSKNEDTGTYMKRGRPKRYKCTQRWREHAMRRDTGSLETESCFWAELEELYNEIGNQDFATRFQTLDSKIQICVTNGDLKEDPRRDSTTYGALTQHLLNSQGQP